MTFSYTPTCTILPAPTEQLPLRLLLIPGLPWQYFSHSREYPTKDSYWVPCYSDCTTLSPLTVLSRVVLFCSSCSWCTCHLSLVVPFSFALPCPSCPWLFLLRPALLLSSSLLFLWRACDSCHFSLLVSTHVNLVVTCRCYSPLVICPFSPLLPHQSRYALSLSNPKPALAILFSHSRLYPTRDSYCASCYSDCATLSPHGLASIPRV